MILPATPKPISNIKRKKEGKEVKQHEKALALLKSGKVSFSKAAELAKMNLWDFSDLVKVRKIIWIKNKKEIEKDLNSILN